MTSVMVSYCKFRNFREDFIFAKLRMFRDIKTLAKWQNHSNAIRENKILAKIAEFTVMVS